MASAARADHLRIRHLSPKIAVCTLVAVSAVGCATDPSADPPASSIGVDAVRSQCPPGSNRGWPATNHPGADTTLVPDTPTGGTRCEYLAIDETSARLVGSATMTAPEVAATVTRFNAAPPVWAMSCPFEPARGREFAKYRFDYPDGSHVVIEYQRAVCPPSIDNGRVARAIAPPAPSTSASEPES